MNVLDDRAVGCLVGQAYGDALGVPYEYGSRPLDPPPELRCDYIACLIDCY